MMVFGWVHPDTVAFMGDTYECFDKPLHASPALKRVLEVRWRDGELSGHTARWVIDEDGLLLLTGFDVIHPGAGQVGPLPIDALFPGWGGEPYPADWFGGIVTLYGAPFTDFEPSTGIKREDRVKHEDRFRVVLEVSAGDVLDFEVYEAGQVFPLDVELGKSVRRRERRFGSRW